MMKNVVGTVGSISVFFATVFVAWRSEENRKAEHRTLLDKIVSEDVVYKESVSATFGKRIAADASGKIIAVTFEAAYYLGYTKEEMHEMYITDLMQDGEKKQRHVAAFGEFFQAKIVGEEVPRVVCGIKKKNGVVTEVEFTIRATVIDNELCAVAGFIPTKNIVPLN